LVVFDEPTVPVNATLTSRCNTAVGKYSHLASTAQVIAFAAQQVDFVLQLLRFANFSL
jgi:hypothetical protein